MDPVAQRLVEFGGSQAWCACDRTTRASQACSGASGAARRRRRSAHRSHVRSVARANVAGLRSPAPSVPDSSTRGSRSARLQRRAAGPDRSARGQVPAHAAALSRGGRALVIAGPSGFGKSTLALHLAFRGFTLLSDDMTALRRGSPEIEAPPRACIFGRVAGDAPAFAGPGGRRGGPRREGDLLTLDARAWEVFRRVRSPLGLSSYSAAARRHAGSVPGPSCTMCAHGRNGALETRSRASGIAAGRPAPIPPAPSGANDLPGCSRVVASGPRRLPSWRPWRYRPDVPGLSAPPAGSPASDVRGGHRDLSRASQTGSREASRRRSSVSGRPFSSPRSPIGSRSPAPHAVPGAGEENGGDSGRRRGESAGVKERRKRGMSSNRRAPEDRRSASGEGPRRGIPLLRWGRRSRARPQRERTGDLPALRRDRTAEENRERPPHPVPGRRGDSEARRTGDTRETRGGRARHARLIPAPAGDASGGRGLVPGLAQQTQHLESEVLELERLDQAEVGAGIVHPADDVCSGTL